MPDAFVLRGGGNIVPGPVAGSVAIRASVGRGGANRSDDTRGVQTALNAVPTDLGGAGDSLKVDGIVGPLTIGAITQFQQRWLTIQDGRCDPAGPTLALLNSMPGVGDALPIGTARIVARLNAQNAVAAARGQPPARGPTPAQIAAQRRRIEAAELRQLIVERHHPQVVLDWLFRALRVNDAAERHVGRLKALPRGGTLPNASLGDDDRKAFLLVAKMFKLDERNIAAAEAGVKRVDNVLRRAMLVMSARVPRAPLVGPPAPVNAPLFVSLFDYKGRPALAYVTGLGGFHLTPGPSGSFNRFVIPGRVVAERVDRIYLTPDFDNINSDLQRLTIIHELAHFVGPTSDFAGVNDVVNVDRPARWKALNSFQRLHTADSYAFFATECGIGTIDAVNRSQSTLDAIGEFPKVTANSVTQPVIELPPAGDPRAARFGFPAGF